jgi:purine-binding chemotaxis protein CheW
MQSTQQAIFNLGEDGYSLGIMDVVAIEKMVDIQPTSSLPQYFKGVINLRGDIIPVYSLRKKFGLEDIQPDMDTRFVVTSANGVLVAFEVDKMTGIVQADADQLNEVPSIVQSSETSYLNAIIKVSDSLVLVMDKDGILTEDDLNKIKKLIQK